MISFIGYVTDAIASKVLHCTLSLPLSEGQLCKHTVISYPKFLIHHSYTCSLFYRQLVNTKEQYGHL